MKNLLLILILFINCGYAEEKLKNIFPKLLPRLPEETPPPKVIGSFPSSDSSNVPIDSPVHILFSKEIDKQSCISSVNIQPPVTGQYSFEGNKMIFQPYPGFRKGMTYTINISRRCEDKEGRDLEKPFSLIFSTSGDTLPAKLIRVSARKHSSGCDLADPNSAIINYDTNTYENKEVCKNSSLTFEFSRAMNRGSVESNLMVSGGVSGTYIWSNDFKTMRFIPLEDFENGGTYIVSLAPKAEDLSGNFLDKTNSFTFTVGNEVQKPSVVLRDGFIKNTGSCSPGILASSIKTDGIMNVIGICSGSESGAVNSPIYIHFSESMDKGSVETSFSVQPPISGMKTWSISLNPKCGSTGSCSADSLLIFTPNENWKNGNSYTISIQKSAKDTAGNSISNSDSFTFTVGDDFVSPSVDLAGGPLWGDAAPVCAGTGTAPIIDMQTGVCSNRGDLKIRIKFSEAMHPANTGTAFSISPFVEGVLSWASSTELLFIPSAALEKNKQYLVSISRNATDLAGNYLTNEFNRYFTTGDGGIVDSIPPEILTIRSDTTFGICDGNLSDNLNSFDSELCVDSGGTGKGAVFEIVFSEQMNQSLSSTALNFIPSISGTITWTAADTMQFTANQILESGIQYKLNLSTAAEDKSGNKLTTEKSLYFTTTALNANPVLTEVNTYTGIPAACNSGSGSIINILSINANNVCTGNPVKNQVEFVFSEPMEKNSILNSVSFSPATEGTWQEITSMKYLFIPDSPFSFGERYTIRVSNTASDKQGQTMLNSESISFIAGQEDRIHPAVLSVQLEKNGDGDGCDPNSPDLSLLTLQTGNEICISSYLDINFSEEMNAAKISSVSISPSVNYQSYWYDSDTLRLLVPEGWKENTFYSIKIDRGFTDPAGNEIQSAFQAAFFTEKIRPSVLAVGLESQTSCLDVNSAGNLSGGDWNSVNCFWDRTMSILSAINYKFRGGNSACGSDAKTDNFRIIFNKPMDINRTPSSVSLKRISPPLSNIIRSSWIWSDSNRVLTISFAEDRASGCPNHSAGSFDLWYDSVYDSTLNNYPLYMLQVDPEAKDADGNSLNVPFYFTVEGN